MAKKLKKRPSYGTHGFFAIKEFFSQLDPWLGFALASAGLSLTFGAIFPYAWLAFAGLALLCLSVGVCRGSFYSIKRFWQRGVKKERKTIDHLIDLMAQVNDAQQKFDDFSTMIAINQLLSWVNSHSEEEIRAFADQLGNDNPFKHRLFSLKQAGATQIQLLQSYISEDSQKADEAIEEDKKDLSQVGIFEDFEQTFSSGAFLTYGFVMAGVSLVAPLFLAGFTFTPLIAIGAAMGLGLAIGTAAYFLHRRYLKREKALKNKIQDKEKALSQWDAKNLKKQALEGAAQTINGFLPKEKVSVADQGTILTWKKANPTREPGQRKVLFAVNSMGHQDDERVDDGEQPECPEGKIIGMI